MTRYYARDGMWRRYARPPLPPSPDPGWIEGWGVPAWRDEFDGVAVDTEKWTVWDRSTHGNLSFDWGDLSTSAASVSGGQLQIRMTQLAVPVESGGKTRWWQTGALDTNGKHNSPYGRWEMRGKLTTTANNSRGTWCAFWLRNPPALGEIDIMESWGDPPLRARSSNLTETSTLTLHELTTGGGQSSGWTYEHRVTIPGAPPYSTASGFHTWAVEYTPTYMRGYFDGMLAVHCTPDGANGTLARPWMWGDSFNGDWYMRLNLAMGDPYWTPDPPPDSPESVMPADFLIDYVRFWALPA